MGLAIKEFKIHHLEFVKSDRFDAKTLLANHIALMLSILPKGTVCKGVQERPITTLYMETFIHFEHPSFDALGFDEAITRLELDQVRIAWMNSDESIDQDTVLLGVKYLTADGRDRYAK